MEDNKDKKEEVEFVEMVMVDRRDPDRPSDQASPPACDLDDEECIACGS